MSRKAKNMIERVADWDNLMAAHRLCRRGKGRSHDVARFEHDIWLHLGAIQNELLWGMYRVGEYRRFQVYDPKRRQIAAAPYRDRVVMQAICRACEPLWTRAMIDDTYACVKGRGPFQAVARLQQWMRYYRRRGETAYALHLDVAKFFDSIPHEVAKRVLRRRLSCERTLKALDSIIDSMAADGSAVGIPTGNLTSQWIGNLVLNEVDQVAKRRLGIRHYMRYMDDFMVLSESREQLLEWRTALEDELAALGLRAGKVNLQRAPGVTWVGYRVWPAAFKVKGQTLRRIRRRTRKAQEKMLNGYISPAAARDQVRSYRAHAVQGGCRAWWARRLAEWRSRSRG